MTIATDIATYYASQKRISVTSTSATLETLLGEEVPNVTKQITLVLDVPGQRIHLNFGAAAAATTFRLPPGGMTFDSSIMPLDSIQLWAATTTLAHVLVGTLNLRVKAGAGGSGSSPFLDAVGAAATDIAFTKLAVAAGAPDAIIAAAAGSKNYLMGIQGSMSLAGTVTIEDSDATDLTGPMNIGTNGGLNWPVTGWPYTVSPNDKGLSVLPATGAFNGVAQYLTVPN